jgi:hypothetical protein
MKKIKFKIPKFKLPKGNISKVKLPKFKLPKFKLPNIKLFSPKSSNLKGSKKKYILLGILLVLLGVLYFKNNISTPSFDSLTSKIDNVKSNFIKTMDTPTQQINNNTNFQPVSNQEKTMKLNNNKLNENTNTINTTQTEPTKGSNIFTNSNNNTNNELQQPEIITSKNTTEIQDIVAQALKNREVELKAKKNVMDLTANKYQILKTILDSTPSFIKTDTNLQKALILAVIEKELGLKIEKDIVMPKENSDQSSTIPVPTLMTPPVNTQNNEITTNSNNLTPAFTPEEPKKPNYPYVQIVGMDIQINDIYGVQSSLMADIIYKGIPFTIKESTIFDENRRVKVAKITTSGIQLKDIKKGKTYFIAYNNTLNSNTTIFGKNLYTKNREQ